MKAAAAPWVSVVIPARNAGPWISDALGSLLRQTESDWEAIVVNDGSDDDTEEKARAFGAGDGRIKAISGVFGGASAARNEGIKSALGTCLLFLDSDDWLSPDFLKRMRRRLEAEADAGAVYGAYQRVATSGATCRSSFNALIAERALDVYARECGIAIHAIVLRKSCVLDAGGFDVSLKTCEDWDLWQRLAINGVRFVGEPDALVYYRMRKGSLSSNLDQLLSDAHTVRRRGFVAASRVPATGGSGAPVIRPADLGSEADWAAYLSIWSAAAEIGAGQGDGVRFVRDGNVCEILSGRREEAAGSIVDGLIVGAAMTADELAAQWSDYCEPLASLANFIESQARSAGCARAILYAVELRLLNELQARESVALAHVFSTTFQVGAPASIQPPDSVDTIEIVLTAQGREVGRTYTPALPELSKGRVHQLLTELVGIDRYLKLLGRPKRLTALAIAAATAPRSVAAHMQQLRSDGFTAVSALRRSVRAAYGQRMVSRLETVNSTNAAPASPGRAAASHTDERSSKFWEELFETPDPWNYRSPYEREKYEFTLSLIPADGAQSALEIACAEGIFTERLAERVKRLKAVDISETALERARLLCAKLSNIEFDRFDLAADEIPDGHDLIVCSEVLYFLKDEEELKAFAMRVRDALVPGGRFITAHAFVLIDDKSKTGFDWNNPFGAKKINDVFASTPGLQLEKAIVTELYRIDSFVRIDEESETISPEITYTDITAPIERDVARYLVRGGVAELRGSLRRTQNTTSLPVLMYHRISSEGPDALSRYRTHPDDFARQVDYLRRNGFYTPAPDELIEHWRDERPLPGRPVFITFDDGYKDFRETAWDILFSCDLSAHVFLVTDKVGGVADWDAGHGDPAPLMDWRDVAALAREGVTFGSHLASHRRADGLGSHELMDELRRSRTAIERHLGVAPRLIAPPFGLFDVRFSSFAREAGYELAFSTHDAVASIGKAPFSIPRLEPVGGMNIEMFAEMVGRQA